MLNAISRPAKIRIARALVIIALLIGALLPGFPVLWMLSSSFKSNMDIFAYPPALITDSFSLGLCRRRDQPGKLRFFQ